jgi:periplasmic protein TonB
MRAFRKLTIDRKRWDLALLASFAAHLVVLFLLTHHSAPIFVMPSDVALGTPGSSGTITYLAPTGAEKPQLPRERPRLVLHPSEARLTSPPEPKSPSHENEDGTPGATLDATARGGSLYGTRIPGAPLTGHEIIPALPQVFPDPAVSRADLPPGVQGDVVVVVTIDEHGNVVELKLVRGIGYGVEERVLATLRQWRFSPASKDGVTIASQHIVTFHYPS